MQSSKEFYLLTKKRIARAILKLLEDCKSAAYYAYVSNLQTSSYQKSLYIHTKKAYSKSYFETTRRLQIRSILYVCEDFADKADAKRVCISTQKKAYSKSYFEAARWLQIRSILYVCEDFADKADAKRALLYAFY